MDTATQEIIYQLMMAVVTGVFTIIGAYVKRLIETKIDVTKYGFDNERVERIIDNAVHYSEGRAKQYAKQQASKISSSAKLTYAKQYINRVDADVIAKYGTQLDDMIARKVVQKFGV